MLTTIVERKIWQPCARSFIWVWRIREFEWISVPRMSVIPVWYPFLPGRWYSIYLGGKSGLVSGIYALQSSPHPKGCYCTWSSGWYNSFLYRSLSVSAYLPSICHSPSNLIFPTCPLCEFAIYLHELRWFQKNELSLYKYSKSHILIINNKKHMGESIKIVNFGPIKEIEIAQVKPFMVLVGESGSGKSTIMKVLSLFRWIYKRINLRSYLRHSQAKDCLLYTSPSPRD